MNKAELVSYVAAETSVTGADAQRMVQAVFSAIGDGLARDEPVAIAGFGKFAVRSRAGRSGRNSTQTGEPVVIAASKAPSFKAPKALRAAVNVYWAGRGGPGFRRPPRQRSGRRCAPSDSAIPHQPSSPDPPRVPERWLHGGHGLHFSDSPEVRTGPQCTLASVISPAQPPLNIGRCELAPTTAIPARPQAKCPERFRSAYALNRSSAGALRRTIGTKSPAPPNDKPPDAALLPTKHWHLTICSKSPGFSHVHSQ